VTRDWWDAATYEQVAAPQQAWAREIIARAGLQPGELVLDAGCGGGGVTKLLLADPAHPRVIAVDADAAMVAKARETLPPEVPVAQQDLLELTVEEPVDVVFSCAVFHWITDHERLFARLRAALKPGGRLVAQCGGHGNIAKVLEIVGEDAGGERHLFATAEDTERRLREAGFTAARAWLEPKPTEVPDMATYLETVVLHGLPRARAIAEAAAPQIDHLDYVRLNMEATT
jgi:trans-aconitate 2-methyltransferase